MSDKKRTHDQFYKNEKGLPPKDIFVKIGNYLEEYKDKNIKIADIGTAIGSFPDYLSKRYSSFEITGFEYLEELIEEGKKTYPHIKFDYLDVNDSNSLEDNSFDVISMIGVLSIFDNYILPIKNCLSWIKPGGKLFIFGMFNDYDIDVYLGYKHSTEPLGSSLEGGWNIVSKESIRQTLNELKVQSFEFHDFEVSVDIKKKLDDPARSWTEKYSDGSRFITNGLCLLQPQKLLIITK